MQAMQGAAAIGGAALTVGCAAIILGKLGLLF
jgi:hypothetical protein